MNEKKLLNEILPQPQKTERASPRERTAAHLRRIVAAGLATLPLGYAHADNSVPGDKGKKGGETQQQGKDKPPPPQPPPYGVVDPIPQPYREDGYLHLETKPAGATVKLDELDTGLKTPLDKYAIPAGKHTLTVTAPDGTEKKLTVDVKAGKTLKQSLDLRAKKSKK